MSAEDVSLAELLAALSVATDLGMGQEPEKAVRACLVATHLARAMDVPERDVHDVYYCTLLQHLGCTAPAHETTHLFGDDLAVLPQAERTDEASLRETLALMTLVGKGTGMGRVRHLARTLGAGKEGPGRIMRAVCEVGARLADRLGLGGGVRDGLFHAVETWDGRHGVHGLAGQDIAQPARFSAVATQAVIFDRLGGKGAAMEMVRRRAGAWFDPAVAATFTRMGEGVLRWLADVDVWAEVIAAEPQPARHIPASRLDTVAAAFADMVDLKTPFTLGHSSGVAEVAAGAAQRLELSAGQVERIRLAALLHDLGRVAMPNAVWEKPGPLTTSQWEGVRLHAYHGERILARSTLLEPLGRIVGRHHERQDGSGYHRGATGAELSVEARLLGVADAFQAMTQPRPHRPALEPAEAASLIESSAVAGSFDPECARAVVEAAGQRPNGRRGVWPAGLSDREVEVLRLVARGQSNREVAASLVISPRTAEHHVQHIYAKIGISTRAAAALFAMEHGLLW
ncbi:MAG TPA: HD domain-containing phosphohydrolase [Egibacteraceae bacterium]|nr:HD domain-containing phosphohydrolase [Egibacteraceae bacterium]